MGRGGGHIKPYICDFPKNELRVVGFWEKEEDLRINTLSALQMNNDVVKFLFLSFCALSLPIFNNQNC